MREVVDLARQAYGKGEVRYDNGNSGPHEAGWLALEIAKARVTLGVQPKWSLVETVTRTMNWYQALHVGARDQCLAEIAQYESREAREAVA